ncbi:hypothetical protein EDB81DRAFT_802959 [Dactylonectria macrodidyma]|uniref:Uncharacterized protein n=1 Tax=Dactylonectria macrodidyma TaxID=307937 RepID=A0A9P9IWY1_9HYPO|nr:hypothetical protein EDB81DRAFT_802959 [Dactylonectria macrodidyma]
MARRKQPAESASEAPTSRRSRSAPPPNSANRNRNRGASSKKGQQRLEPAVETLPRNVPRNVPQAGIAKSDLPQQTPPSAASFLSIPSTPPSGVSRSREATPKNIGCVDEKVLETPPNRGTQAAGPPNQRTPQELINAPLGTSPFTPIQLSSDDESDRSSDVMIYSANVVSTNKRKRRTTSTSKSLPAKRAKTQAASLEVPTRAPAKQKPASRQNPAALGPTTKPSHAAASTPRANTPIVLSSSDVSDTNGSSSQQARPSVKPCVKAKYMQQVGSQQASPAQATSKKSDPDCFIVENGQTTPKRRPHNQDTKPTPKKRRIGNPGAGLAAAAIVGQTSADGYDSDCQILYAVSTPKKRAPGVATPSNKRDANSRGPVKETKTNKKSLATPKRNLSVPPSQPSPDCPNVKSMLAQPATTTRPSLNHTRNNSMVDPIHGCSPVDLIHSARNAKGQDARKTVASVA